MVYVIVPKDGESVGSFSSLRTVNSPKIALTAVPITKIGALTIGDRVCVDTCSMMSVGEGMLVGSQSSCLFLINSESMESEYVLHVRSGSMQVLYMHMFSCRLARQNT